MVKEENEMSQLRILQGRSRWKVGGIVACAVLLTGWIVLQYLLPPSPEKVFATTVRALETGDTDLFLRYADPEEVKRLHLTRQNVDTFLHETIWHEGYPKLVISSTNPPRQDVRDWIYKDVNSKSKSNNIQIIVMDDLKNGWTFGVTEVLRHCTFNRYGFPGGSKDYWKLAERLGISGWKHSSNYYQCDPKTGASVVVKEHPDRATTQ